MLRPLGRVVERAMTIPRWRSISGLLILALALSAPRPVLAADCAAADAYVVQRGDTLSAIARRLATTTGALAAANQLANPNLIRTGQVLRLPAGAGCPAGSPGTAQAPVPPTSHIHVVQRGETLSRIAARYGASVAAIVTANGIANPSLIYSGQRLAIPGPGGETPAAVPALPGLRLSPSPPQQGRTLWLSLPAAGLSSITGTLGPWPVRFFREGDSFVGLAGLHALAETGTYVLSMALTDSAGNTTTHTQALMVATGGYARESLTLTEEKTQLLDPQLTIPERERVAAAVAPVTPGRYWQGVFRLPAAGQITSAFGTRRSYNRGPYSSYHAGVDFSYRGGPDIYAPEAGVVVMAEPLIVRGNATLIDHGWGVYSGFWHQSEILVSVGDRIEAGQVIGKIGATGLVTGAHLHWELFVNGIAVDPLQWTRQAGP